VIWPVFIAALWLAVGLELGLRDSIQFGPNSAPSLTLILVTYVALWAPRLHALYAALIAGVCLDLLGAQVAPEATASATTLGPTALGAALGAFTVLTARAMVERANVLALPAMALALCVLTNLVVVFCYAIKGLYDPAVAFNAMPELFDRLVSSLYTAVAAVPVGLVMTPLARLFGFSTSTGRRSRGW